MTTALPTTQTTIGDSLRLWRRTRSLSQMELALDADISPRHLSFIETGRSQPSREVVLQLAAALQLPFRHQNSLLMAAGYAPAYNASSLDDAGMAPVRYALERHLAQHEPYPAVVVNAGYDILMANSGMKGAVAWIAGEGALDRYPNMMRLMFAEDGLRPYLTCWPLMRDFMLARLREEQLMSPDAGVGELADELAALTPAPDEMEVAPDMNLPVVSLELVKDGLTLRFFSTITSFGTPLDATVQELRLESMFPSDEATQAVFAGGMVTSEVSKNL